MSSPEQGEDNQSQEQEREAYFRVSRFEAEDTALTTYAAVQQLIFDHPCDLSAYRFLFNQVSHVLVIGGRPTEELDRAIAQLLAGGAPAFLPADIIQVLQQRRDAARQLGPWVEGHYRPGRPLTHRRQP
jgi:hypothetical protein